VRGQTAARARGHDASGTPRELAVHAESHQASANNIREKPIQPATETRQNPGCDAGPPSGRDPISMIVRSIVLTAALLAWCRCALALNPALDVVQYTHTVSRTRHTVCVC